MIECDDVFQVFMPWKFTQFVLFQDDPMLTVADALAAILNSVTQGPVVSVTLEEALGMTLAEPVVSDVDSPPFDKSLMDGYAVRTLDLSGSPRANTSETVVNSAPVDHVELDVIDEVTAGNVPTRIVRAGEATRIMTGAPIPQGADAVIPIEETRIVSDSSAGGSVGQASAKVCVQVKSPVPPGRFILRQGAAVRSGATVLPAGRILRAQEIAALAELGSSAVSVFRIPRVAILATGDELVPPGSKLGPGQIRNSNESMLAAQIQQAGGKPVRLGIARDNRDELRRKILAGLECDFLLLSGGVSAGKLDLVPSELEAAGVRQVFHKIQMRPGKPLWFGVLEVPNQAGEVTNSCSRKRHCFVFGLPGNPVSSMVCCELFVRSALRRWCGIEPAVPTPVSAELTHDFQMDGNRPTYHPGHLNWTNQGPRVSVVDWIGSSDLFATVDANCMVYFPSGSHTWKTGARLDVFPW